MDKLVLIEKRGASEASIFRISNNTRYALLSNKNEQVMTPVSCKAFLEEVVWSYKTKKPVPRTDFNAKEKMFDVRKARMSVKFESVKQYNLFMKNLIVLNDWEDKHKIKKTEAHKVKQENTVILIGDKNWVTYVWKVGIWAFLVKCLSYKSFNVLTYPEKRYWEGCKDNIETILSKVKVKHVEKQLPSARAAHSSGSILGINNGNNLNTKFILEKEYDTVN